MAKTEQSLMTMTTEKSKVKLLMAGTGTVTIEWGDGENETRELLPHDYDFNDADKSAKFVFSQIYSNAASRTITITGENITHLRCGYNLLKTLDVSQNAALEILYCNANQLTALDVSQNIALTSLDCTNNGLTALDVTNNIALTWLVCAQNQLTTLNIRKNTDLIGLSCGINQLEELDVTENTKLEDLRCYNNLLKAIDVSKNIELRELDCEDNQLEKLDISKNVKLYRLECQNNQLEDLNVTACPSLRKIKSHSNKFPIDKYLKDLLAHINKVVGTEEINKDKFVIHFPMYKTDDDNNNMYKIYLVNENGKFYLSDEEATWTALDKIFELKEPDVLKNLAAIMTQYGVIKHSSNNSFIIECTPQDIHIKLSHFVQALSFMLNMKIFYV